MMMFLAPSNIDGDLEVQLDYKDVEMEIEFYKTWLMLFAARKELSIYGVKESMAKIWNSVSLPNLFYHDEGFF